MNSLIITLEKMLTEIIAQLAAIAKAVQQIAANTEHKKP